MAGLAVKSFVANWRNLPKSMGWDTARRANGEGGLGCRSRQQGRKGRWRSRKKSLKKKCNEVQRGARCKIHINVMPQIASGMVANAKGEKSPSHQASDRWGAGKPEFGVSAVANVSGSSGSSKMCRCDFIWQHPRPSSRCLVLERVHGGVTDPAVLQQAEDH